ncbi:MAG: tetratricopeptide repeat protein [Candidatus Sumerlaeaceae bacterium]|nr:tetratricopeptide repeat protein [Candidatus Sumerlaeaceae bacterium]
MAEQSAYAILNLRKGVSEQEIKLAYVEMVKRYDPEKHTERFMIIQNAFERLRDPKKRAKEDVFTYNYPRGEFQFSPEEKTEEPLEEVLGKIKELEQQLVANPTDEAVKAAVIPYYFKRSWRHTQKKLWTEAMKDWVLVLQLDPTNQKAKNNLLFSYVYLGYYYAVHELVDESTTLLEKCLRMWPDNLDVIHNLALVADKAGDKERANKYWSETVKRWKELLDKAPEDEYLRACIIEVHKHHGGKAMESVPTAETKQEALESYREILKFNPADFEAQYNIVATLMDERKFEEAIEELKKLQQAHPKNLDVVNLLGWAYLNAGKMELAFSTWRRGLVLDPKSHQIKDSIMRARLQVGKKLKEGGLYTQALVHFKELQKMMPNQWELHYEIGDTLCRKGDRRSALTEFQRVLELDPKNKAAKKAMSEIRLRG